MAEHQTLYVDGFKENRTLSSMTIEVNDFPHPSAAGLGCTFQHVIWQMLRYREHKCWVNIDKANSPYRQEGHPINVWDSYFLQDPPDELLVSSSVEDPLDLPFSGHRDWTIERQRAISQFARTRVRLRPEIQAEVDSFKAQFFKGKVLACHLRGSDKREEYPAAKMSHLLAEVRAWKERYACQTVFLLTDCPDYHKLITEGVGAVSITMPRSQRSLHHNPPRGPYYSGLTAVMDTFIAAEANVFVYTPSNLSVITLMMARNFEAIGRLPSKCVIEPFCPRVDRALGLTTPSEES
jgi:hypothetical protein